MLRLALFIATISAAVADNYALAALFGVMIVVAAMAQHVLKKLIGRPPNVVGTFRVPVQSSLSVGEQERLESIERVLTERWPDLDRKMQKLTNR